MEEKNTNRKNLRIQQNQKVNNPTSILIEKKYQCNVLKTRINYIFRMFLN